ncbi:hypothetical protein WICPIJ_009140 [Wickerhamomyces pijperi]|uniref:Uncharacterized protein n=1 Tax=Wickerhamomyces pijperi TaxID=599730 RepID=A0A9P8PRH7_WICPI|nr:hypothetical protein WICPIJ_009140 [Wickerhamomyces pijperi]
MSEQEPAASTPQENIASVEEPIAPQEETILDQEEPPQVEVETDVNMVEASGDHVKETQPENNDVNNNVAEQDSTEPAIQVDYAEESKKIEEKSRNYLARQTKPVIIPSFAAWFDFSKIHEVEKRSLPEFFSNNSRFKTEQTYRDIRDFMIHTYRLNPFEYLTLTAVRRNIATDVASIVRIHAFLEQWGLINYQIDPKTKPSLLGPQYTGHFQIVLDTPEGFKPFIPENAQITNTPELTTAADAKAGSKKRQRVDTDSIPLNLEIRRNVYDSSQDAVALNEQEKLTVNANTKNFTCNITGNDSTEVRYHNLKSKASVSSRVFKEGQFSANFQASDFIRLERLREITNNTWTDQETLLLLEGIELFNNDWEKIAFHIGTRSKEESIKKFIQLPIEDKYLSQRLKNVKIEHQSSDFSTNEAVQETIRFLIEKADPQFASKNFLENNDDVKKAASLALGSLIGNATKAKESSKEESAELLKEVVELEINNVEAKLQKLSILEQDLIKQRKEVEAEKQQLIVDRLALRRQTINVHNKLVQATKQKDPHAALKISQEAIELAYKSFRSSIIKQAPKAQTAAGEETEASKANESEKQNVENDEMVPLSQASPETFKLWTF